MIMDLPYFFLNKSFSRGGKVERWNSACLPAGNSGKVVVECECGSENE